MASVRFSDLIILVVFREKTEQGKGLDTTVCTDVLNIRYSGLTVTSNINNDLTSGKGAIADLRCLDVYFRKVLKVAV